MTDSYQKEDAENQVKTVTVKTWIAFEDYLEVKEDYTDADLEDAAELWAKKKGLPKPAGVEDISWCS